MRNAKGNGKGATARCTRTGKHFCKAAGNRWKNKGCAPKPPKPQPPEETTPTQLWLGNNDPSPTAANAAKSRQHVELSALKPGASAPSSPTSNQSQPQAHQSPLGKDTNFSAKPSGTESRGSAENPAPDPDEPPTYCLTPDAGQLQPEQEHNVYVREHGNDSAEQTYSQRYEQLSLLRAYTSLPRLKACHVYVDTLHADTADVVFNKRGRARWQNLRRCGLRWPCSVCAPFKAEEERRRLLCALLKAMKVKRPLHHPAVVELIGENGQWHPPLARPVFEPDENGDDLNFDPEDFELMGERKPQAKYCVGFITATTPHKYADRLKSTSNLVIKAWNYTVGNDRDTWKRDFGIEAFVRCFDLTVGLENGWHPHIHAAVIVHADKVRSYGEKFYARALRDWFAGRWDRSIGRQLGRPDCFCRFCGWKGRVTRSELCPNKPPGGQKCGQPLKRIRNIHPTRGVQFEWVKSPTAVVEYLNKLALWPARELTSGHRKVGGRNVSHDSNELEGTRRNRHTLHRSPFQVLRDFTEAHRRLAVGQYATEEDEIDDIVAFEQDLALWHEYEQGMQGRSALRTSKGFWSHPDWGVSEMTREDQIMYLAEHLDPAEADALEDPDAVLKVVPWLYTWFARMCLEGWVLRVCEEHLATGAAFGILKAYCVSMSGYWRPPNLWDPAVLRDLVDEVEKARRRNTPRGNKP